MFSFELFDSGGVPDVHPSKAFWYGEAENAANKTQLCETEEPGKIVLFHSDFGFSQDNTAEEGFFLPKYQEEQPLPTFPEFGSLNEISLPPYQLYQEEVTKPVSIQSETLELIRPQKAKPHTCPLASLRILKNHQGRLRDFNGEMINTPSYDTVCRKVSDHKLSTHAIIRLAGENFIQSCSQKVDTHSVLSHPFPSSFIGPYERSRDVELVQFLLASAEKVGQHQLDRASKLLNRCNELSSNIGNPVQRLVHYFSEALREKIERETGTTTLKGLGKKQPFDLEEAYMNPTPSIIAFHQKVPFSQVCQFVGIQAITENIAEAKRVHVIDLAIRSGTQSSVLMQALAARREYPLEHLKITAVGTKSEAKIEEAGKRLVSFAQSLNLPFSFKVVMVADMLDLTEDLFELDDEEDVAVYSPFLLSNMIGRQDQLECVMRVIKTIDPRVMVVSEVEASHNSLVFVNRFTEALFFYGALFDSVEDCLGHDELNRLNIEFYFSHAIRNIVAAEGRERTIRHVLRWMSNMFSVEISEIPDRYDPEGLERGEGGNETEQFTEQPKCRKTEDWRGSGNVQTLCSDLGFYQDDNVEDGKLLSNFGSLADLYFDIDSPPFRLSQEEISKLANIQYNNVELIEPQVVEPVDIAKKRSSSSRQLTDETFSVASDDTSSTKLAGEKFIQSCSQIPNGLGHPYASSFLGHSNEEMRDVELVQCLLASADKVGQKQFDSASKLLNSCDKLSSSKGNPVQRLVYYFSEALREKIDRETGTVASKGLGKKHSFDLIEALMSPTPTVIAFQKDLPFSQVIQFAGMQMMIENVADSRRVHMIDLEIRSGTHCVILMHALAARCECPIEHLKITAIGTKLKPKIEETVMVQDMLDLTEDHFELYDDEAVAFYSPYALWSMIAQPDRLERLLRVIRNTSPCVMVVNEIQAKLSSPLFVNRFIEALFIYGAIFDSVADCLAHDDSTRMVSESQYFSQGIRNILAAEGEERKMRKVSGSAALVEFKHQNWLHASSLPNTEKGTMIHRGHYAKKAFFRPSPNNYDISCTRKYAKDVSNGLLISGGSLLGDACRLSNHVVTPQRQNLGTYRFSNLLWKMFFPKMMSEVFPLEQFISGGALVKYNSLKGFGGGEVEDMAIHNEFYGTDNWIECKAINSFGSDLGFYQENAVEEGLLSSTYQEEQQMMLLPDFGGLDDMHLDIGSPLLQSCDEEIPKLVRIKSEESELAKSQKQKPYALPLGSLGILKNNENRFRQLNGEKIYDSSYDTSCMKVSARKLSTEAIIRFAGEKFIQSSSQRVDDLSVFSHPFSNSFSGASEAEMRDVELVQYLLASAEKVGQQQFERASKLLNQCGDLSFSKGNPIERLVYHFSEALQERIDRKTGRITSTNLRKKQMYELEESIINSTPSVIQFHQQVPFYQVTQFTGIQAIVENVEGAKRVHVIDLEIRNGIQCTVLMQALAARAECPLEHLKITAVGTTSKPQIDEIGERLKSFAQSMSLSFSFNVVMVADMLDLKEDLFELDAEEAVAIYSSYLLWTMIAQPDRLERLMRVINNINPCIMVVAEIEANQNSPVFVTRFTEALFYYGAFFDCLEDCMEDDNINRMITESMFSLAIRNVVASEGEERTMRHVNIGVWRAFFARFGMVETELSMSSLYQAKLVTKNFPCGSSCTLEMNGKCLTIGWKGTPIFSLSAWKFLRVQIGNRIHVDYPNLLRSR
ncbi:hypothetical protein RJ639_013980 [Escallonia herrerae]|uniref:DELLA protein n=1 Tax=Escallonia herrerae TaxID=1293975 RepID=A0AA88VHP1_9ASTE|nr:hypothetical protein RJ639_013980 [Escallonia herrerae]